MTKIERAKKLQKAYSDIHYVASTLTNFEGSRKLYDALYAYEEALATCSLWSRIKKALNGVAMPC